MASLRQAASPLWERITTPRSRYSLRLRLFGAIALAGLAPQLLVAGWSLVERDVPGRMWSTAVQTADRAAEILDVKTLAASRDELTRLARDQRVHLRLLDEKGEVVLDVDADDPTDALHPIEAYLFDAGEGPALRELDESMGPLTLRPEVSIARQEGHYIACSTPGLLLCQAIRRTDGGHDASIVHVQKSSERAVDAVYTLRHQLIRLSLVVVPLVLLLAFFTGKRLMAPIDRLRTQALAKAIDASPDADLPVHKKDEVGDLAAALNGLLAALAARGAANESFITDLVHELKSPVAAVRATADVLAEGDAPLDAERAARFARVLSDSASRLDQLVTQFLDLARAEAGMPDEERSIVDLAKLAKACAARIADDERYAGIRCDLTEITEAPATVSGVEHRLEAVVRELLDNAASFAGPAGKISVRVVQEEKRVLLAITDSGPGIAADLIPRVFNRFFTTRGKRRGTGLGLSLVRAVVEAHGGRVSVVSEEGGGARFEVRLPQT